MRGGDDTYVVRKQRKTPYILQKYLLVVTYCDDDKNEWHMLMLTELRESLAPTLPFFLDCAMKGVKVPSAKELRIMSALQRFMGDDVPCVTFLNKQKVIRSPFIETLCLVVRKQDLKYCLLLEVMKRMITEQNVNNLIDY